VVVFSREFEKEVEQVEKEQQASSSDGVEELSGSLGSQKDEDKLMHSILEGDKDVIDDGKLIAESITQGLGAFTPDLIYEQLVQDYKIAKKLFGETIIRQLSHYSPNYVEKNISIPEFQRELRNNIEEEIDALKEKGNLSGEGMVTDRGLHVASLVMYVEEIAHLLPKGMGEKEFKKRSVYGDKEDISVYHKSRYRDVAIRQTVKTAIRRAHKKLTKEDLRIHNRSSKGKLHIIYGLDASGSMKGRKLKLAKQAGIALAFKAIHDKNKVGLIVFGSEVKDAVPPTTDFLGLIKRLTNVFAGKETDIAITIMKAIELFPRNATKHLILLTDALPTKGDQPEKDTLDAVSIAVNQHITVSLIGINLDEQGEKLAQHITDLGKGRLYSANSVDELDVLILEEYNRLKGNSE